MQNDKCCVTQPYPLVTMDVMTRRSNYMTDKSIAATIYQCVDQCELMRYASAAPQKLYACIIKYDQVTQ